MPVPRRFLAGSDCFGDDDVLRGDDGNPDAGEVDDPHPSSHLVVEVDVGLDLEDHVDQHAVTEAFENPRRVGPLGLEAGAGECCQRGVCILATNKDVDVLRPTRTAVGGAGDAAEHGEGDVGESFDDIAEDVREDVGIGSGTDSSVRSCMGGLLERRHCYPIPGRYIRHTRLAEHPLPTESSAVHQLERQSLTRDEHLTQQRFELLEWQEVVRRIEALRVVEVGELYRVFEVGMAEVRVGMSGSTPMWRPKCLYWNTV